jgi:hypothetical protein
VPHSLFTTSTADISARVWSRACGRLEDEEVHFIELLDQEREKPDLVSSWILQRQCRAPHQDGPRHPPACGRNPLVPTEQALQGLPPQAFGLCAGEALAEGRLHGVEAAGPGGQRGKVQPHQGSLPDDRVLAHESERAAPQCPQHLPAQAHLL